MLEDPAVLSLDVRDRWEFAKEHIPGALFIGLGGSFAPWVGALINDLNQKIVLIAAEGQEEEAVRRLSRVGYDHAIGYLNGGMKAWKAAGETIAAIESIDVESFPDSQKSHPNRSIVDVRKPGEFETTHILGAESVPFRLFPYWQL